MHRLVAIMPIRYSGAIMHEIFDEGFKVCTWDVDVADRLTMAAAYNYCQEVAGHHATDLGIGRDAFKESGLVWILSRMSMVLDSRPKWGDRLVARTWPRGTDRLFAMRDYELLAPGDRVVGRGRSAWLIVDMATFRPRRPESLTVGMPVNEGRDALPGGAGALKPADGLAKVAERRVVYSDLDYNGHMNNARYVQWIQDALDPGLLADASSLRLDINYVSELRTGASAGLFVGDADGDRADDGDRAGWTRRFAIEGRKSEDGQASFRGLLSLR